MRINMVGPFEVNAPFGTEIAFRKGFEAVGHEVFCSDPNVSPGMTQLERRGVDLTLVFKTCCGQEGILRQIAGPKVVYQPDDMRFPHIQDMARQMLAAGCRYFLGFDEYGAEIADGMGFDGVGWLPLTADPDIYFPEENVLVDGVLVGRDIDVSFIGSLGDPVAHRSRRRMLDIALELAEKHGWRTFFAEGIRDVNVIRNIYCRSKLVLNHATDVGQTFGYGYGVQCRHFEVGFCRTPLFTNMFRSGDPGMWPHYVFSSEKEFTEGLPDILSPERDAEREDVAIRAYNELMSDHIPAVRAMEFNDIFEGWFDDERD